MLRARRRRRRGRARPFGADPRPIAAWGEGGGGGKTLYPPSSPPHWAPPLPPPPARRHGKTRRGATASIPPADPSSLRGASFPLSRQPVECPWNYRDRLPGGKILKPQKVFVAPCKTPPLVLPLKQTIYWSEHTFFNIFSFFFFVEINLCSRCKLSRSAVCELYANKEIRRKKLSKSLLTNVGMP